MRLDREQQRRRKHVDSKASIFVWLSFSFAIVGLGCSGEPRAQSADALPRRQSADSPVAPDAVADPFAALGTFVDEHCIDCHNQDDKTGGLALDVRDAKAPAGNQKVWEKVVRKLRHRQMPPAGHPRPEESTYDSIVAMLETSLDRASVANPNPGRTATFRRLTRTEYRNAIRDLLALDVDVSSLLPKDESSHGFDNVTVGELSPTLLERYLSAAQKIGRLAIGRPIGSPSGRIITLPLDRTQENHENGLPFGTRGGAIVRHNFPLDGEYGIQLRLTRNRNEKVEGLRRPHAVDLILDGKLVKQFTVSPPQKRVDHDNVDRHLKLRIPVKAGPHEIGVTFLKQTAALLESERQPSLARFNQDRHARTAPALYSISIVGPDNATGPGKTPSRRRVFVCYPSDPSEEASCAAEIISTLLRRAYRRPVTEKDLQAPLRFFKQAQANGGFEAGIEMALRAILVSPQFLFRIEQDPSGVAANTTYRVSDVELATRLSFFLWSSIPDDELLDKAARGELSSPNVLEQQVRRMLDDRRSETLVSNFAAQWLYLRNLESANPDPRAFPDFDDNLRQAFRQETELFFQSIVREDRSVLELLKADYTFLNERLAKHYGIPHVYGSRFRRIELGNDSARGGLLGQGSILTVTSYANRTSPVVRGKWILTNILGIPPPPPPPKVPPLKETSDTGKLLSTRQRIAVHRENPACASCHNLIDPVGFGLENYDAVGRWRTEENGIPVDASGNLPDGTKFDGASEFGQALLKRPDLFVHTLAEKLLTYALGRGLEHYDAPAIRKVVRDAAANDYRFSSLILGIAKSTPFQMRRSR
jgi:mono/diheme cytochrome c family protein